MSAISEQVRGGSLIGDAIKNYFMDAYEQERTRTIGKYYASELSGFGLGIDDICLRELVYKYKMKIPFDKSKAGTFKRGEIIEEWLAEGPTKFLDTWKVDKRQKRYAYESPTGYRIGGKCDFLLKRSNGFLSSEKHIVELKTIDSATLDWIRNPLKQKPDNVMQLSFYLWLEQCEGTLVYIKPGTLETKEFVFSPNKERFDVMVQRGDNLHKFLTSDTLPPYKINWKCNQDNRDRKVYCEYLLQCITDGRPPTNN